MAVRDRVALWMLTGGVLAALGFWWLAGPVPAMVVGLLAVLAACAAYRVERSAIDLDHLPLEEEGPTPAAPVRATDQ